MNDKISIIIPVYNVEKYINKCIESIIAQTYSNFEVIIVNDGSTDNSIKTIVSLIKNDDRFIIYNKKNGGVSDARNFGLSKAIGEYITFIDPDDYVDNDYLEYLYYLVKNYNADISICSLYNIFNNSNNKKIIRLGNNKEGLSDNYNIIKSMCYHDQVDTSAVAKLYKRYLFENITYPLGKIFEDTGITYKLFLKTDKIAYGFKEKYYYNIRENSIVTSKFNVSKLDLLEMTDNMRKDVLAVYPSLNKATKRRALYARFSTLNQMINNYQDYPEFYNKIDTYIKKNSVDVFFDKKTPKRDMLAIAIYRVFGIKIYKKIWYLYLKYKK